MVYTEVGELWVVFFFFFWLVIMQNIFEIGPSCMS